MSGTQWTYWTDYDADQLSNVPSSNQQRVWADWLQVRVERTVLRPLRKLKNEDIQPTDGSDSSALLVYSVSLCCAIEAMGKYLNGGTGNNGDRFREFLKYMDPKYKSEAIGGKKYEDYLWKDFRNGLAHGFAISKGKFEQRGDDEYFAESTDSKGNQILSLNWDKFFDDFEQGTQRYFDDVRNAPSGDPIALNFLKVFRDVCIDRN